MRGISWFLLLTLFHPADLWAATLTSFTSKENKEVALLAGDIVEGDADRLAAIIKTANANGRMVSGVRLNSFGGSIAEGVKLADVIKTAKIASVVANGATCASACFVAFAAGAEKFASYQARIGVHGASDKNGQETASANSATIIMARIVKELGVPPAIIGRMVVTPPSEIVWLSPDELKTMGVTLTGKPSQLSQSAPAQPQNGAPMQLPSAQPVARTPTDWNSIVSTATERSAAQNNGRPDTGRACQPELKVCNIAIFFTGNNGKKMMVKVTEDLNGKFFAREVCTLNQFYDVRDCVNWDTKATHKDMKNAKGDWYQIDD